MLEIPAVFHFPLHHSSCLLYLPRLHMHLKITSFNQPRNNKLLFPLNIGHVWCLLRWKLLFWPYGGFDSWVNKYINFQASGRLRLCSAKRCLPFVLIKATAPFCLLKHFHSQFLGWFPKGNRTGFLHPTLADLIESSQLLLIPNLAFIPMFDSNTGTNKSKIRKYL